MSEKRFLFQRPFKESDCWVLPYSVLGSDDQETKILVQERQKLDVFLSDKQWELLPTDAVNYRPHPSNPILILRRDKPAREIVLGLERLKLISTEYADMIEKDILDLAAARQKQIRLEVSRPRELED